MPPRLSIMCTSHASRVRGHHGAAVLERAVVAEDDVQQRLRRLGREAGELLDGAADAVVAQRDLALQAPGIGEVDGGGVGGVGLELADVVQQRAGDRDVAVDAGERRGHRADALGDRQAVLEQAVHVGLVVELGRRRAAVELPRRGVRAENAIEQRVQVRVLHRGDELAQLELHRLGRVRRPVDEVVEGEGARGGLVERAQRELCAKARVDLVAAAHVDGPAGLAQLALPRPRPP